jgi:hypothetical protein
MSAHSPTEIHALINGRIEYGSRRKQPDGTYLLIIDNPYTPV